MLRITQPSQVAIFAGASYIVTVHRGDLRPLSKLFSDCRASEAIRGEIMGRSSGYLLYRILDVLVDYCFPVLNKIIDNMDAVEADMAAQDHEDLVHELAVVRRDVVAFRRIVRPQVEVMETLETKEYAVLRVDPDVYFGDLADHTRRIWEELEALKEASDELSDTMVAINQTLSNNAIRFLTVFFTVTLPVTMVGSLYGMNVPLPFQGHWWSFWALLGISILPTFGMLYLFRRRGWL
jgi:magnesium transporter